MIVCICRGVSDSKIKDHIQRGATTLRDLQRCGIGDQCGSCHSSLKAMFAAAAAEHASAVACPAHAGPEVIAAAM